MSKKQTALHVSTVKALSQATGYPVRTLFEWMKAEGFPAKKAAGWPVAAVHEWAAAHDRRDQHQREGIEAERAARIRKLELQNAILAGDYVTKAEVKEALAGCAFALKRELDRTRLELSTRLVGMTAGEANAELEAAHRRILATLHGGKWK